MKLEDLEELIAELMVSVRAHLARRLDSGLSPHDVIFGEPLDKKEEAELVNIDQLKARLKKAARLVDLKTLTPLNITSARERYCETGALPKNKRLALLIVRIETALAQMTLVNGLGGQEEMDAYARLDLLEVQRERLQRQSCRVG